MTPATLDVSLRAITAATSGDRPPLFVAREDLFFYTRKWQDGERESADARTQGELRVFDTGRDLLDWLDADDD